MNKRGMNFFEFITAVFVILKYLHLTEVQHWSWFKILAPMLLWIVYAVIRWTWEALDLKTSIKLEMRRKRIEEERQKLFNKTLAKDRQDFKSNHDV